MISLSKNLAWFISTTFLHLLISLILYTEKELEILGKHILITLQKKNWARKDEKIQTACFVRYHNLLNEKRFTPIALFNQFKKPSKKKEMFRRNCELLSYAACCIFDIINDKMRKSDLFVTAQFMVSDNPRDWKIGLIRGRAVSWCT